MRAGRRITLASLLVIGATAGIASPARAVSITETRIKNHDFAGEGCGSRSTTTVTIPHRARHVRIYPRNGAIAVSVADRRTPVARMTVARRRVHGKRVVRVVATGAYDVCTHPDLYENGGWELSLNGVELRYRIRLRLWHARCSTRIGYRLHTRRVGCHRARLIQSRYFHSGRGVDPCISYCAEYVHGQRFRCKPKIIGRTTGRVRCRGPKYQTINWRYRFDASEGD